MYDAYDIEGQEVKVHPDSFKHSFKRILFYHPSPSVRIRRRLTNRFATTTDGDVVKITNGEILPPDEPLFLLRARDVHAIELLETYYRTVKESQPGNDFIDKLCEETMKSFKAFREEHADRMKLPGVTRGK